MQPTDKLWIPLGNRWQACGWWISCHVQTPQLFSSLLHCCSSDDVWHVNTFWQKRVFFGKWKFAITRLVTAPGDETFSTWKINSAIKIQWKRILRVHQNCFSLVRRVNFYGGLPIWARLSEVNLGYKEVRLYFRSAGTENSAKDQRVMKAENMKSLSHQHHHLESDSLDPCLYLSPAPYLPHPFRLLQIQSILMRA